MINIDAGPLLVHPASVGFRVALYNLISTTLEERNDDTHRKVCRVFLSGFCRLVSPIIRPKLVTVDAVS